jgi:lysophospholipase L1-like esterase
MRKSASNVPNTIDKLPLGKKLLFSLIPLTVGLLLIEGGARVWLHLSPPPPPHVGRIESNWFGLLKSDLATANAGPDLYVPDAHLFWTLRPDIDVTVTNVVYKTRGKPVLWNIRTNSAGYRGPLYPAKGDSAAPVVVCLGDSCTFGFRVDEGGTYPCQLQQYLRDHGLPAATVMNYGVPGYSSFQGQRLLKDILAEHRPDVVVLAFGANDLESDRYSDAEKAERASATLLTVSRWLDHSAAVRLLRGTQYLTRTEPGSGPPQATRVSPDQFRRNLLTMVRAAQDAGAQVVLLDLVLIGPAFQQVVADVARECAVPWIDGRQTLRDGLAQLLSGERFGKERAEIDRFWNEDVETYRLVYYDELFYRSLFADRIQASLLRYLMIEPVHPNSLGHTLIAEAVGRHILPH